MIKLPLTATFTLVFFCCFTFAQTVNFQTAQTVFEHPNKDFGSFVGFEYPFVPGDINQDGIADFYGHSFESLFVQNKEVYLGQIDGTFERTTTPNGSDGAGFSQYVDFDKDGIIDVLTRDDISYSDGSSFTIPIPAEYNSSVVYESYQYAEDFNGDNILDVLIRRVILGEQNEMAIYLSTPSPEVYTNVVLSTSDDHGEFDVKDINGDGFMDIMVAVISDGEVSEFDLSLSNGDGTFRKQSVFASNHFFEASQYSNLEMVDIENDGDLDFIFVDLSYGVTLIANGGEVNGDVIFEDYDSSKDLVISDRIITYQVGDLNNDGLLDLLTIGKFGDVNFHINEGSLKFSEGILIDAYSSTIPEYIEDGFPDISSFKYNLNLFDFDADGDLDLLSVDGDSKEILLYENGLLSSDVEPLELFDMSCFPNPNYGHVSIKSNAPLAQINVLNINGEKLLTAEGQNQTITSASLARFLPGMYIIELISTGGAILREYIIKI